MTIEIERKFLVVSDAWRAEASAGEPLRQAYLARTSRGSVRVRISPWRASLTVKSRRRGLARDEFTYEIAHDEAERMLSRLCVSPILEKVRHTVRHGGMLWQVDVYGGGAEGLVMAEIELERPEQPFTVPDWAGREVTFDPAYRNSTLARAGGTRPPAFSPRASAPA